MNSNPIARGVGRRSGGGSNQRGGAAHARRSRTPAAPTHNYIMIRNAAGRGLFARPRRSHTRRERPYTSPDPSPEHS